MEEEINLSELLSAVWKKKYLIMFILAIFIIIGIVYTEIIVTPKFTASTTLLLVNKSDSDTSSKALDTTMSTNLTVNSKLVSTYSELIRSKNVLREVRSNLHIVDEFDETNLKKSIKVSSVEGTEIIKIDVTLKNAENASVIANEIAAVFSNKVKEIYKIDNVYVVDKAETPETPSNINHIKDICIFTLIGLVIGVMAALVQNMFDTTIKSEEDIERLYSLPTLAIIPLDDYKPRKGGKR